MSDFEESHLIAGGAVRASRLQIDEAARAESAKVYPNFQWLQGPFETGFLAGVRWMQDHADGSAT